MRHGMIALMVAALTTASAAAQSRPWAEKMFKDGLTKDFGNVPLGAKLSHRFTITNIYGVRMEITSIKSGCGCVKAEAVKRVLEPLEKTTIDVTMDAHRFTGAKTVGITVTVGPDFISSAQLQVSANSRADIVFNPGQVSFGTLTRGQAVSQVVDVEYAGVLDWKVTEATAKDLPVEVSVNELYRNPGRVGYRVKVTLKKSAPVGALKGDVFIKTNDPASPVLPLLVEALVQSAVTVSPETLSLGNIRAGETLTRRVVVRGSNQKAFRVVKVEGLRDGITLDPAPSATAAPVQLVTFKIQLQKAGDFKYEIKIKTDLQEDPVRVTIEGSVKP